MKKAKAPVTSKKGADGAKEKLRALIDELTPKVQDGGTNEDRQEVINRLEEIHGDLK